MQKTPLAFASTTSPATRTCCLRRKQMDGGKRTTFCMIGLYLIKVACSTLSGSLRTANNANKAKTQCLNAFVAANPACNASFFPDVGSGLSAFGCDVFLIYSFASKECHLSYNRGEKTNLACTIYQNLDLISLANRMTPVPGTPESLYIC